jgi:AP-1 complex subunit gamma-1
LQAAVPKSQKLTLQAINKSTLDGGDEATQGMKIVAATGVRNHHSIHLASD